jgi:hypothetical protein
MAGMAVQTAISAGGSAQGADLFGDIFSNGMNIFVPSYSRKNEFEADKIGLTYMAGAGYDPRAAVVLWKKAAKMKKDRTSVFASHPASGARAAALEKLLPEAMKIYEETLARQGKKVPPVAILKVTDFEGTVIDEYKAPAGDQVIQPEHAFLISSILSDNEARSWMFGRNSVLNLPFPAAAKTGTSGTARGDGSPTRAAFSHRRPASPPASSCLRRSRRPRRSCSPPGGCSCNWPATSPHARAGYSVSC